MRKLLRKGEAVRKFQMNWDGKNFQWRKMFKGKVFRVACSDLDLPRELWNKNDSYQRANEWWEKKRGNVPALTEIDRRIDWASQNDPNVLPELVDAKKRGETDDASQAEFLKEFLTKQGWTIPENAPPELVQVVLGNTRIWQDRYAREATVASENTIGKALDEFLAILSKKGKPKTFKETREFTNSLRQLGGILTERMDCKQLNEVRVTKVYQHLDSLPLADITKKKRWLHFRRFVRFLFEQGKIELPRNIASKLLTFTTKTKAVKEFPAVVVQTELAALPKLLRCWALLGLNCGMTNADIGNLKVTQIAKGYLTRKRVKTEGSEDVPTVTYALWPETTILLDEFKSDGEYWFLSQGGTPLISSRVEDGKAKIKDLVGLRWKRYGKATILLKQYRSIAATALESHEHFGRYVSHFLGHSAKSIKDKHYAAPSQKLFDKALDWLRKQLLDVK